ncbi:hypothetical protein M0805_001150 [Coniferiporia weirii]|nr:hypothetical protein M0805_001150 [Coniferiporia weirii]
MHLFNDDDIRFDLELGGGALMDMGCYPLAMTRYVVGTEPVSVLTAQAELFPGRKDDESKRNIDIGTTASLVFPDDITASIVCHTRWHGWGPFGLLPRIPDLSLIATCEGGTVEIYNYILPSGYHSITVKPTKGKKRVEKVYVYEDGVGEEWWSTYRYQLEFFVDKVKGREPKLWVDGQSSVSNMHWIEEIYNKTGLGSRPKSNFTLTD